MKLITRPPNGSWFNWITIGSAVISIIAAINSGIFKLTGGLLIGSVGVVLISVSNILLNAPTAIIVALRVVGLLCILAALIFALVLLKSIA